MKNTKIKNDELKTISDQYILVQKEIQTLMEKQRNLLDEVNIKFYEYHSKNHEYEKCKSDYEVAKGKYETIRKKVTKLTDDEKIKISNLIN